MRLETKEVEFSIPLSKVKKKRNVMIMNFEGISDLVNHCKTAPINTKCFTLNTSSKVSPTQTNFTMTKNYDEAVTLLMNGWSEGSKKLTTQLKIANSQQQAKEVKKAIFDIVGFQASVPRYLQGVPTNMVNKKVVKQKQKVVTLCKAVNYSYNIKAEQILQDSIKFIQIVQAIESQGIRVNVDVVSFVECGNEAMFHRIPIKRSSERLNISKMSFSLMHPSFLRRILFRLRETEMRATNTSWGFGYGNSTEAAFKVPQLIDKNEYYIPSMIDEKQALEIVNRVENAN